MTTQQDENSEFEAVFRERKGGDGFAGALCLPKSTS